MALLTFVCEDNEKQLAVFAQIIKQYIMIKNLDLNFVLATVDPLAVLAYVQEHPQEPGLYFIDIDLNHEMNGLNLAAKLRKIDHAGKIVFVTTHSEMLYLTFTYKIEALDYIIKDNSTMVAQKIRDCIDVAYERYLNERTQSTQFLQIKLGDQIRLIDQTLVMFFETAFTAHRVILHLANSELEFYGSIKEIERAHSNFYRCHKSYLINPDQVKQIDSAKRLVEMSNHELCLVSVRALPGLLKLTK